MSKNRKKIFLIFISFFLICGFILALFLFIYLLQNIGNNPDPAPVDPPPEDEEEDEEDDDGPIIIGNGRNVDPYFAAINSDGTFSIYDKEGKNLPLELDDNNWKNLEWSPDNQNISVIGTNNGLDNIFLYNLEENSGEWVTLFNQESDEVGVSSYRWVDEENIYYMQGENNNSWLNRFNINTNQERRRVIRIDGEIVSNATNLSNRLVIQTDDDFEIVDLDGNLQYSGSQLNLDDEITSLYLFEEKILVETTNSFNDIFYYEYDLSEDVLNDEIIFENFNQICLEDTSLIGYRILELQKELRILKFSEELETISASEREVFDNINLDSFDCNSSDVIVYSEKDLAEVLDRINWYIIEDDIQNIEFLENAKEVKLLK